MGNAHPHRRIVDVVLGAHTPERRWDFLVAAAVTIAVSTLLGLCALRFERRPKPARKTDIRIPIEVSLDERVDVLKPSPAPRDRPEGVSEPRRPMAPRAPHARAAQAAAVVAQEPRPSAPVDLTADTFVVGSAKGYAGAVTSRTGTGRLPGQGREAIARSESGDGAGLLNRSAPIGLASQSWSCPWPGEADPLPSDQETVVIRVVVRPDGTAESVAVVADPGHGFGEAAASCAMRTHFMPARAADGEPVRATSAPIRVRFIR